MANTASDICPGDMFGKAIKGIEWNALCISNIKINDHITKITYMTMSDALHQWPGGKIVTTVFRHDSIFDIYVPAKASKT